MGEYFYNPWSEHYGSNRNYHRGGNDKQEGSPVNPVKFFRFLCAVLEADHRGNSDRKSQIKGVK